MTNVSIKKHVGVMPGSIDGLLVLNRLRDKNIKISYLAPKNTPEANWAYQFLPKNKIVEYTLESSKYSMVSLDAAGAVAHSDLAKQLKKYKINYFLVHHGISASLNSWAKKNKIGLIATDFEVRQKFEDKIWFDQFLTKNNLPKPLSQIYQVGKSKLNIKGKLVLQHKFSEGGEGTFFINKVGDFRQLATRKKIKPGQKYLLRQFVSGRPCGITLFIGTDQIALSALRLQCYLPAGRGQKNFTGIQWLPSRIFSGALSKEINKVFISLGKILLKENFFGYANVDFIIDSFNRVKILECNPRFAASTTQLILFPETVGRVDTARLYLQQFFSALPRTKRKAKVFGFPKSNFAGSLVYITSPSYLKNFVIKKLFPCGVYSLKGEKIIFVTPDVSKLGNKEKQFIFYSDASQSEIVKKDTVIGEIISGFSLYDHNGKLNKYGKIILNNFKY